LSRNALRKYGVHIVRHAMGALGSLNFFSLEKFLEDCEIERRSKMVFDAIPKDKGVIPLYFPGDNQALSGIREIAEKGNPKECRSHFEECGFVQPMGGYHQPGCQKETLLPAA
jgi:trimethylamine--corrinoid protein Co-methyltransferase